VQQIANISPGVPNVLLESDSFRGWVESDLRIAWNQAVDDMVIDAILATTPSANSGGVNPVEEVMYAISDVAGNGYVANVLVLSPSDTLAYLLAMTEGGDAYIKSPVVNLRLITSKNLDDASGFVADANALGQLFLSPARLAVFEENAGASNSSTVRFESHGQYVVQRDDAVIALGGVS
jgi:hypothetical protein